MSYNFNPGDTIYCDASFLVRLLFKDYRDGKYEAESAKILAQILVDGGSICISTLAIDELITAIKKDTADRTKGFAIKRQMNNFLEKWGVGFTKLPGASYKEILSDVRNSITTLAKYSPIFWEFPNYDEGINLVIDYLDNSIAKKPRDAFHLAIAVENNAVYLVTADKKFVKGISKTTVTAIPLSNS